MKLWELAPSPHNIKVRLALRYKGIEFESTPVDPANRSAVVEASGQEGTPVIEDRGIVLNDSEAIFHYLDANYRDSPRLYPNNKPGRKVCDEFKKTFEKRLIQFWLSPFFTALGVREAPEHDDVCAFHGALQWLDRRYAEAEHICGADMVVCDLRVAAWTSYALPSEAVKVRLPMLARTEQLFAVEAGQYPHLRAFLEPWNKRLAQV